MPLLDHFARHRSVAFTGALALLLLVRGLSIRGIAVFADRARRHQFCRRRRQRGHVAAGAHVALYAGRDRVVEAG